MRLYVEMRLYITTCQHDIACPLPFGLYFYVYTVNSGMRVFVCRCPFDYGMSHIEMIFLHIHVYHIEIRLCIFMFAYSCISYRNQTMYNKVHTRTQELAVALAVVVASWVLALRSNK